MRNYSLQYVVNTWLLTIVASPFCVILLALFTGQLTGGSKGIFDLILLTIVFGALFSFPALILYYLPAYILQRTSWPAWLQKIILSVAGISLIAASFLLLDKDFYENLNSFTRSLFITYCIMWAFGTTFFFRESSTAKTHQRAVE